MWRWRSIGSEATSSGSSRLSDERGMIGLKPLEEFSVTSQEEQMLNALVERVNSTQLSEKDMAAEALLARGFANNPDAVYILSQSVLVQNIALEQARAQLTQAQEQVQQLQQSQQPARSTSFLGGLLGHRDPQPPPPPSGYQQVYAPQSQPDYQAPYNPQYPAQPYGAPQYAPGPPQYAGAPPSQPSFLRGAAQTAAGVAAGALAFEGVESLLHGGFGHPGMGMGMGGWGMPGVGFGMGPGGGFERPVEENVVNNYYDSPAPEHHMDQGNYGQDFDRGGEDHTQNAGWDDSGSGLDNNSGSSSDFNENSDFDSGGGDAGGGDFGSGDSGNF